MIDIMIEWFSKQLRESEDVITGTVQFLSVGREFDETPTLKSCTCIEAFDLSEQYEFIGMSGTLPILKIKELALLA
jgi:hypothetical protein